jgi:hypothetical protein
MPIGSLALLTIVCLVVAVAPAMADSVIYSNGAINGTVTSYTINFEIQRHSSEANRLRRSMLQNEQPLPNDPSDFVFFFAPASVVLGL